MSWGLVPIGSVATVLPGFAFKSEHLGNVGTPVIKIGNITDDGTVDIRATEKLPETLLEPKHQKFRLQNGDIVLAMTGATAGKAGRIIAAMGETFMLNQRVARLIPERVQADYFWYVISTEQYRERFYNLGGGAAQPNMSGPQIASVKIPIAPPMVQAKIASILSVYDDLIENNRKRIALLEEATRMLYREWFVCFRFPGHEHVRIIDGLPDGWERKPLGAIVETNRESYGARELPEYINYIDISSVAQGKVVSRTPMATADAPGRARRKARDGDVIWSNVRPNLRAYSLILEPAENDVFSTGFTVLSARAVPYTWLYQFVTTENFVGHLVNHATGAGYPAVRPDDFERAVAVVPPERLLKLFHEATETSMRMISKLNTHSEKLIQARDLLLPRLMNGEIAV